MSSFGNSSSGGRARKGKSAYERIKNGQRFAQQVQDLAYLHRGVLAGSMVCDTISAGSLQPTRLSALGLDKCVLANQHELYLSMWSLAEDAGDIKAGTQGLGISTILEFDSLTTRAIASGTSHKYEIQSVISKREEDGSLVLASIDARGQILLNHLGANWEASVVENRPNGKATDHENVETAQPTKKPRLTPKPVKTRTSTIECHLAADQGWAGLSYCPTTLSQMASCQLFARRLFLHSLDTGAIVRSIDLIQTPTQVQYVESSRMREPLVAVTEYSQLSVWDARAREKGGCIARTSPSRNSCLYAMASCAGDSIICAGQDRVVYVYDSRTWRVRNRWKCPLKYDCVALLASPSHENVCYAAGLDNELMCGRFKGGASLTRAGQPSEGGERDSGKPSQSLLQQNHRLGFRSDSSWTGIDVLSVDSGSHATDDVVMGVCESGGLYVVNRAQFMLPGLALGK